MEKVKTIVDREQLSSVYIGSKQNFKDVLKGVESASAPVWKSAWFYGPVGVSVIAITLSVTTIDPMTNTVGSKSLKNVEAIQVASNKPILGISNESQQSNSIKENGVGPVMSQNQANSKLSDETHNMAEIKKESVASKITISDEDRSIRKRNVFPNIEGNFTGEISIASLCSGDGIKVNDEIRVIQFNINYFSGLKDEITPVIGNTIPKEVCEKINAHNLGSMLFITDIKGVNPAGQMVDLNSMNFIVKQ